MVDTRAQRAATRRLWPARYERLDAIGQRDGVDLAPGFAAQQLGGCADDQRGRRANHQVTHGAPVYRR